MDSIQKGIGEWILEKTILLSEHTSPIVYQFALGYVLQMKQMAILGIYSPMPRCKIILSGDSRKNYEM